MEDVLGGRNGRGAETRRFLLRFWDDKSSDVGIGRLTPVPALRIAFCLGKSATLFGDLLRIVLRQRSQFARGSSQWRRRRKTATGTE